MRWVVTVLRNLAFYLAFYIGTVFVVLACVVTLLLASRHRFRRTVDQWARWHRWCMHHLLEIGRAHV